MCEWVRMYGQVRMGLKLHHHAEVIICLIHKFMHHKHLLPRIYHNYFTENYKIHCYNNRNKNDLYIYLLLVNSFGSRAIYFKGCTLESVTSVFNKYN